MSWSFLFTFRFGTFGDLDFGAAAFFGALPFGVAGADDSVDAGGAVSTIFNINSISITNNK